ncbi:MAG: DUF5615 family PIN-like protein [Armatimonadetes bacterium]|nr:DUF5615 family PIN-like protein [Armatimonadota bacterium]
MRLWLDNHLSPRVARRLRDDGFDVRAILEEPPQVQGLSDEALLEEAHQRGRALVTYNVGDFGAIHQQWLATGRSHAGIILLSTKTIRQKDIGSQIKALRIFLGHHRRQADLKDQVLWLRPAP